MNPWTISWSWSNSSALEKPANNSSGAIWRSLLKKPAYNSSGAIWRMDAIIEMMLSFIGRIFMQCWEFVDDYLHPYYRVDIREFEGGDELNPNELYASAERYLERLDIPVHSRRLTAFCARNSSHLRVAPSTNEVIEDSFQGVKTWWTHRVEEKELLPGSQERKSRYGGRTEKRRYDLKVAKANADKAFLLSYFEHIRERAREIDMDNKELKIYTNDSRDKWSGVPFKHPCNFDNLCLPPPLKENILTDLDRFKRGKEFYGRTGRLWKRGYLLHGPPGTGKSSLIAAIANKMRYDVYDLELTQVRDNFGLRKLLMDAKGKSIIVIEDIDCSLNLTDRLSKPSQDDERTENQSSKVTLSGLLNFTDGLFSCSGEERIIVFTTNHKELLDPALLRRGRMDTHIELSSCTYPVFTSLVCNYLRIDGHRLFPAVKERMESGAEITPAEIVEVLMNKIDNHEEALNDVICALDAKRKAQQIPSQSPQTEAEEEEGDVHEENEANTEESRLQSYIRE